MKVIFLIFAILRAGIILCGFPQEELRPFISERMKHYKVPGLSLAIVNEGGIEWEEGFGHLTNDPKSASINAKTVFQAASVSKPLTAFGAMLLVQQGKVSLDENINVFLKRWRVPENDFTKTEKVTLRRLLSHTAGISVIGFPGYELGLLVPEIIDILNGKSPTVNTDPIRVIAQPGLQNRYSGGGYTIVQLMIEDLTGEPFDAWMKKNVLRPLGMLDSTFSQPLPSSFVKRAAIGHHRGGEKVMENWHNYPEMGAAGLWTTPRDLAKFVLYIQSALKNQKNKPLQSKYVKEMLSRQDSGGKKGDFGLGFFLANQGKDLVFEHQGQNEGFISSLYGFAYQPESGYVIMMNDDSGWDLMDEIVNKLVDVFHWPDIASIKKVVD